MPQPLGDSSSRTGSGAIKDFGLPLGAPASCQAGQLLRASAFESLSLFVIDDAACERQAYAEQLELHAVDASESARSQHASRRLSRTQLLSRVMMYAFLL
jgi:hypothetical protein